MHVTQPPCKALNIYDGSHPIQKKNITCLGEVSNDNGVTIGELLHTLQSCSAEAIALWRAGLLTSRTRMEEEYKHHKSDANGREPRNVPYRGKMTTNMCCGTIPRLRIVLGGHTPEAKLRRLSENMFLVGTSWESQKGADEESWLDGWVDVIDTWQEENEGVDV